jgi:pimeloyl-ACP methyl ester carboxylesterase
MAVKWIVTWAEQMAALDEDFTVVAFDPRGDGQSGKPEQPEEYSAARYVEDVHRVADAAGAKRFSVWGFSLGATIALQVAAQSLRVDRTVVTGSYFGKGLHRGNIAPINRARIHPRVACVVDGSARVAGRRALAAEMPDIPLRGLRESSLRDTETTGRGYGQGACAMAHPPRPRSSAGGVEDRRGHAAGDELSQERATAICLGWSHEKGSTGIDRLAFGLVFHLLASPRSQATVR